MRTRFLPTDYSTVTGAGDHDFVSLPCPHISSPDYLSPSDSILTCFNELPVFGVPEDLEKWPIDDALSIFLSDVLPQTVNGDGLIGGKDYEFKPGEIQTEIQMDSDGTSSFDADCNLPGLQFEVPKMDISLLPLERPIFDSLGSLSVIPKEEFLVDDLSCDVISHSCVEVHRVVSSVDRITDTYLVEGNGILENIDSPHGSNNSNENSFPLFEMDMDDLGILPKVCAIDELHCFDYIEKQQVVEIDEVNISDIEFPGSGKFDLMKYIVNETAPIQQPEQGSFSSQSNIRSIAELKNSLESLAEHRKKIDDSLSSIEPIIFNGILLFDSDQFVLSEALLDLARVLEVEHLESIFEDANFKDFNQLVVCHELTLMDDSFKTMPAPIFSDHGSKYSLTTLIDDILARLNKVSFLASDDLYLDWRFCEENSLESMKHSYISEMLHEIDTSKMDILIPQDGDKLIFDFILTEDSPREAKEENCKDIVNQYSTYVEEDINRIGDHQQGKTVHQDIHQKPVVEKASIFAESMSSDLEFFLDPVSHTKGKVCRPADNPRDNKMMQQMRMPTDDSKNVDMEVAQEKLAVTIFQNTETKSPQEPAINQNEGCTSVPGEHISMSLGSEKNLSCCILSSNKIIVVNTQSCSEEMIISRRTTYQRILEIEQTGTQVVERDIDLPVDLVISSSVCLAWYHSRNIRTKVSAPDAAFSLCIESIATNVLTSLSFAFSCCILVFEGEASFIHGVMESSEELFAAAASLGIDIQLFYSYSSELTEKVILSSISTAAKSCKSEYPRMPDSESLGESFLTSFPSVNPLAAHAILSSDLLLGKFLEISNEERICALQRCMIPNESIVLLSAASRYGEREDSKSTTTDCSSSLSLPECKDVPFRGECRKKKPKHWHSMDEGCEQHKGQTLVESLKVPQDDSLNFPMHDSCFSGFIERPNTSMWFGSSLDKKSLGHFTGMDMVKDCVNSNEFPSDESMDVSNIRKTATYCPRKGLALRPARSCWEDKHYNNWTGFDLQGEVINAEGTPGPFIEDLSFESSDISSPFLLHIERDRGDRNSKISKAPFLKPKSPMFDVPSDFDYAPGAWNSVKNNHQAMTGNSVILPSETIKRGNISATEKKELMHKYMTQEPFGNLPNQDAKKSGDAFLSKALGSSSMRQRGSPWTIQFLNRVKEKSRLLKQSSSHEISFPSPQFPSIRKSSNVITKRKSPSVLEVYKYTGTSARQKTVEQGRPKRSCLNSLQKRKPPASSYSPTWTPVDKRARRTLSLSANGSGGQRKLIWSDNNHGSTERRL